jgi:hypothetical protein
VFDDDRYFDVFVEYAKAAPDDILVRITVENRAADAAELHVLPTLWFRNRWSWDGGTRPSLARAEAPDGVRAVTLDEPMYGTRHLYCEGSPALLFTDNDTNAIRLLDSTNATPFVKDGIDDFIVRGRADAINPAETGTKCSAQHARRSPAADRRLPPPPDRHGDGRAVRRRVQRRVPRSPGRGRRPMRTSFQPSGRRRAR